MNPPHGTNAAYSAGCHCDLCRAGHAEYQRGLRSTGKRTISAATVRAHIWQLAKQGVGVRAVAEAADLNRHAVQWIKYGRVQTVHTSTARRILAVDRAAALDGALTPAYPTRRLIERLVDDGYTKLWIARQLGYRGTGLPHTINTRKRIRAITASRIERLYRLIQQGRVSR